MVKQFQKKHDNGKTIKKKHDNGKPIIYKLKFIDSFRFMSASLSSLVDNLSEIYNKECKTCTERKKKSGQCAILLGLKITDSITNVKNVINLNQ